MSTTTLRALGLALLLAAPGWARAQDGAAAGWKARLRAPVSRAGWLLQVGALAGRYTDNGVGNMYFHALQVNRGSTLATLQKPMTWTDRYVGYSAMLGHMHEHQLLELRFTNRHTRRVAEWTDKSNVAWRTEYRVQLNELSMGYGYAAWRGHLRPGVSFDFGLFRVQRRDASDGKGDWRTMYMPGKGLISANGQHSATAAVTLFCDVAPLKNGAGLTLRPYYQRQLLQPDLLDFSLASYVYRIHNYGLLASWTFLFGQ